MSVEAQRRDVAARVGEHYAVGVSDYLSVLIGNDDSPLGRQYRPDLRELDRTDGDRADPIGDAAHSPVKGIVHRYPNRVLLMPLEVCAVYCRFCFRREKVGREGHGLLSDEDLDAAVAYIATNPAIREVILTGGDPLVLSPRRMRDLLARLDTILHVRIVRLHSRVPVADPARLSPAMLDVLASAAKTVYAVVHVNHADELTPPALDALRALRRAGCVMLSQSVLLRGVNDDAGALADLFQTLAENGVKPYYLHHPDLAEGTGHFRLSPETGQDLLRAVRPLVSGLAMPTYVLDIPGGYGKAPIGPCDLTRDDGIYHVRDRDGAVHAYDPGLPR